MEITTSILMDSYDLNSHTVTQSVLEGEILIETNPWLLHYSPLLPFFVCFIESRRARVVDIGKL
jgi:hypothetical protein